MNKTTFTRMRKIICLLFSVYLVFILSGFDIAVKDIENDIITVSGELPESGNVSVIILNPGTSLDGISPDNYLSNSNIVQNLTGGYVHGNKYSFDIKMLPDAEEGGGNFTAIVQTSSKRDSVDFMFYSAAKKKDTIDEINGYSDGQMKENLSRILDIFGLSEHDLAKNGNADDIAETLYELKTAVTAFPEDNEKMKETLLETMLISAYNQRSESLLVKDGCLIYLDDILKIEDTKEYNDYFSALSERGRGDLNKKLIGGTYQSAGQITDAFNELLLYEVIKNYKEYGYGHISSFFEKYADEYAAKGFKNLGKLTKRIGETLINSDADSLNEIKTLFNSYDEPAENDRDTKKYGGRVSSGAGQGAGFVPNNQEEEKSSTEIFSDIKSVEWAREAIEHLHKMGAVAGRGNGLFFPNSSVTRAELVKMVVSSFGLASDEVKKFSDTKNHWAESYIGIAGGLKIVNGVGEEQFMPDIPITREQASLILYNCAVNCGASLEGGSGMARFLDDEKISEYAREAVYALKGGGIIDGKSGNMFFPEDELTRAEAAKLIFKVITIQGGASADE